MKAEQITGENGDIIKPRIAKSKEIQQGRVRNKGEVFTAAWVCNYQNNAIDEGIVFNETGDDVSWKAVSTKINFHETDKKHPNKWKEYVSRKRLEITCGEAPYLVSRYDMATGEMIAVTERIGLLDRKMRVVNEHVRKENTWYTWAKRALQSVYGYEWQGDNLLIARESMLVSFVEYFQQKFGQMPFTEIYQLHRLHHFVERMADGRIERCHSKQLRRTQGGCSRPVRDYRSGYPM